MSAQDAPGSPLDLPQEFAEASSYQVRDELTDLIERDLLGPWDGELEVFPPRSPGPLERYLVGRLGPKHEPASSREAAGDAVDAELSAGGDASRRGAAGPADDAERGPDVGVIDGPVVRDRRPGTDELSVTVSWGRYAKSEQLDEAGNPRRVWSREPVASTVPVRLDGEASQRIPLIGDDPRGARGLPWLSRSGRGRPGGWPGRGAGAGERAGRACREQGHGVAVPAGARRPRRTRREPGRRDRW